MTENTETMVNNTNMLAELIEAKVALAKAEMQLEWQKAELAKKDHSKLEPDLMAPLFEALAKAQAEFGTVSATSRVTFKNVDFKFAPLSEILGAVRPALNKYGLTLTQQTKHIPFGNANGIRVVTTLLHESGVSYDIESVPVFYNVNDIKNLGAQVTYLRRYEVKTLLGIEADSEELDLDNVPNLVLRYQFNRLVIMIITIIINQMPKREHLANQRVPAMERLLSQRRLLLL